MAPELLAILGVDIVGRGPRSNRVIPLDEIEWIIEQEEQAAERWAGLGQTAYAVADWRRARKLRSVLQASEGQVV